MIDNIIPSVIGTLTAEVLTLPICTIKTVYQNNKSLSISQTINLIIKNSGYRGFIQASYPAILSQVISTSTKYSFYSIIKEKRKTKSTDIFSNSINGMLGGILGSFFSHPVDVWKNYLQRNEIFNWKSLNLQLYYQGYSASIYKNIVLYSCLFPIYDYYKIKFDSVYLSSICTTLTVSIIIQPFDYYKTIKMAGNNNKIVLKDFTRGFGLLLARSIPHFLITMTITEKLKSLVLQK
jgi:hypothetical protein